MKTSFVKPCPVCYSDTRIHLTIRGCRVRYCAACTHQFADLQPTENHLEEQYGDHYFVGGGTSGYQDYVAGEPIVRSHGAHYARLVNKHWPGAGHAGQKRLLDVGCAAGFLMDGFKQLGWTVCGIDPNATMVKYARDQGMPAHRGTLESLPDDFGKPPKTRRFELVCLVQVAAHLTDLQCAKEALTSLVNDKGCVLVETWDSQSLTARILRANWHEYSPPNALHYFSKKSLDRLMQDAGFTLLAGGRPDKRISMGHGRSLFQYKYGHSRWARGLISMSRILPDGFSVPYPSEDLFWRLYQKH